MNFSFRYLSLLPILLFWGCKNSTDQVLTISPKEYSSGSFISVGDTLNSKNGSNGRNIKGTLKAGETYYVSSNYGDATINTGDTLVIQSGVKVLIVGRTTGTTAIGTQDHAPGFVVNGTLFSLGTKDKPNLFTVQDASLKSDPLKDPQSPNTDPAYKRYWGGIQGGVNSGDIIIKWTRLEYVGGLAPANDPSRGSKPRYGIWFRNPNANLVIEDSWLYGSYDDMVRVGGGKFAILRNTFEKVGFIAGECVNVKSGAVGDIAYNLVVGGTGNAFKVANAGGLSPQGNMVVYNNTLVNTGYRQGKVGEGGSIDFENAGRGKAYNNLLVNCKFGLAVLGGGNATIPAADTINVSYGNTYNYGDNADILAQILPTGFGTHQMPSDINGGSKTMPGTLNPSFINYPLPISAATDFNSASYVGSYNFRLKSDSPAIGKGFQGFSALGAVKTDPVFGVTELTPPGKDIGAYQLNATGNQH
jgi:hypothetical protein